MNKVIMMGRIASDPELKVTPNGVTACSFRLAVDRNYQKKGEEKVTNFFNVVAWRATADFISKWFPKGRLILVEGEMQTRQYTDKNGNPATWYEIVVDNVFFTGEKNDVAPQTTAPQAPAAPPPQATVYQQPTPRSNPQANTQASAPQAQNVGQAAQQYSIPVDDNDDYPF